jgi:hypothetical protein
MRPYAGLQKSQKSLGPLKMSLEMAHKVIVPQKKIMSRSFLNSGTLIVIINVADPDPSDPYVFGPPGSGSGSFYHQAKKVRKPLVPMICDFFFTFHLLKMMYSKCTSSLKK